MQIFFTEGLRHKINDNFHRNRRLIEKVEKQTQLFSQNPNHPSLRLHKLTNTSEDTWSISIDRSIRMLFYYRENSDEKVAIFFDLGSHDQLYRKKK